MATPWSASDRLRISYFNPRHPYGWRPTLLYHLHFIRIFQSTPPIRVATFNFCVVALCHVISIHATHTGGDLRAPPVSPVRSDFNPRHPYGWRLQPPCFSHSSVLFQSTPPIRVATGGIIDGAEVISISIHATHTGGDVIWYYPNAPRPQFQSTPPIRVATCPCHGSVNIV